MELKTDALNERSRRAMEAMGATFEGIHRKHMLVRAGESRDSAWYSVVDDEWPRGPRGLGAASRTRAVARAEATSFYPFGVPGIREELEPG